MASTVPSPRVSKLTAQPNLKVSVALHHLQPSTSIDEPAGPKDTVPKEFLAMPTYLLGIVERAVEPFAHNLFATDDKLSLFQQQN
jgi:hypothetical protein